VKINFNDYIDSLYALFEDLIKEKGWVRKDIGYFEYKPNSKGKNGNVPDSWLVVYPDLLEYTQNNKYITTIWLKTGDKELSEEGKKSLLNSISPFKDEDYRGKDMWFNPLYKNGYLCNHTLG
jgi:hypothetical protein